ncbi:hypothetical protein J6P11_01565 [bacterium]|nr:hypothetical protein [bacterium]
MKIIQVYAYEVLNSCGFPTIACVVQTDTGAIGKVIIPSTYYEQNEYHCKNLIDENNHIYFGYGVKKAINLINHNIANLLLGLDVTNQRRIDELLLLLDNSPDHRYYGTNTLLAVSLAVSKAAANELHISLYKYIREKLLGNTNSKYLMPTISFNILNVSSNIKKQLQQFFIIPLGFNSLNEVLIATNKIFYNLKKELIDNNYQILMDAYGAFIPEFKNLEQYLVLLIKVIKNCGYGVENNSKNQIALAMNFKANNIYDPINKLYQFSLPINDENKKLTYNANEMQELVLYFVNKFNLLSIQDPFSIEDEQNYIDLMNQTKNQIQITGDDIYVSNPYLIKLGLEKHLTNSVVIKLDEVATLSEIIEAILFAKKANWTAVIASRYCDTEEAYISDLCVSLGTGQIQVGGFSRSERTSKYNRLIEIALQEQDNIIFLGKKVYYNLIQNQLSSETNHENNKTTKQ